MPKSQPNSNTCHIPDKCPKILAVDDIQDNLDLIQELFEDEPWNVKTVDNARDALAEIKHWHPDLVLLDIMMPEFNGHNLCTAIRMKPEMDDIAVIFLTAQKTSDVDINRGMKMGADDYICKPIDGEQLRKRVRAILQPRWLRRADANVGDQGTQLIGSAGGGNA